MICRGMIVAAILTLTLACGSTAGSPPPTGSRSSTARRSTAGSTSGRAGSWSRTAAPHRGGDGPALVLEGEARRLRHPGRLQARTPKSNSGVFIRIADKPDDPGTPSTTASRSRSPTAASRPAAPARSTPSPMPRPSPPGRSMEHAGGHPEGEQGLDRDQRQPGRRVRRLRAQAAGRRKIGEGDPARGPRPEAGYIGLQNHDKDSIVFFKEVSVRPLPASSK